MGDIIKPSEEGIRRRYMQTEGHFDFCLTCKEELTEGYEGFYHWKEHIKLVFLDWAVHQSHSNRDAGGRAVKQNWRVPKGIDCTAGTTVTVLLR